MGNFLAVDTSGNYLTVVAVKDGKTYSTFIENCAMKHAVSLMGAVDETLKKADLCLDECDFFGAVVGAGSFTGIRIGISTAKGFCSATGKPSLPITSFDVAAYNAIDEGKTLCIVDALHDCYYACGYQNGEVVLPPAYLTKEEVLALAEDGYRIRSCQAAPIGKEAALEVVDPVLGLVNAAKALAEKGFAPLQAVYVRKSSAELNLGK